MYDGSVPFRRADDAPCPLTEYGRQKAEVEKRLLSFHDNVAVVRLTKIMETDIPLFKSWIQALNEGEVIHPFSDVVISPFPLSFAVDVMQRAAELRLSGIIQVSGKEDITYAEIASRMAQRMEIDPALVQPLTSGESGLVFEAVLTHSTLDTSRLVSEIGIIPPDIFSTIDNMIDVLMAECQGVL